MDFWLAVMVSDATEDDYDNLEAGHHSHGQCGIKGSKYPDHQPMGFPYDRKIVDERIFKTSDNINTQVVKVFHRA